MAFKYGDFKSHLKSPYLDEFIAEMETGIENPQLEESHLDLSPFQPLFWSIRMASAIGMCSHTAARPYNGDRPS